MNLTTLVIAGNAGRAAFGLAAVINPESIGRSWIGRVAKDPATHPMIRAFGIRDVAIGTATIGAVAANGMSGTGGRMLLGLGVLVDATDTAAGIMAREHIPSLASVLVVAGGAAVGGTYALCNSRAKPPT